MADNKNTGLPPVAYVLGFAAIIAAMAMVWGFVHPVHNKHGNNTVVGQDRGAHVVSGKEQAKAAYEALPGELQARYSKLLGLLAGRHWEEADAETTECLLEAAGPSAKARGYLTESEMSTLSQADLRVIDTLWAASSHGRFGFAKQAYILKKQGGDWRKLYKVTGWMDLDGKPLLVWDYDKSSARYVITQGVDPKMQNEGQYPTFNRGYNTKVSLDARLVQVNF